MARIALDWSGGVNLLVDPQSIGDNQVVQSKNAYPSLAGLLDKREAVRSLGLVTVQAPGGYNVHPLTLFVPDPVLGLDYILHGMGLPGATAGEFFSTVRLGGEFTPSESIFFNYSDTPLGSASFVNYKGRVIGVVGSEGFFQLSSLAGVMTWTRVTFKWPAGFGAVTLQSQSVAMSPRVVGSYRGRLVFANFGLGMGNWLVFGDRDVQVNWTNIIEAPPWAVVGNDVLATNGRHLELAAIQGQDIIGIREINLSAVGSPMQTALLVLTKTTAIICTGEPAQTTDTEFATPAGYIGDFEANKVNFECGLAGPNAMCETKYGLCWASDNEVWLMSGNTPMPVGTLISNALQDTPLAFRKYWSMAHSNGTVYLAIATQQSTSDTDLRVQHWRLDLRQGVEKGAWFGPQDYENLPDWASPDNGTDEQGMACSIVSKRGTANKDIIIGALFVDTQGPALSIISFNESTNGDDLPFEEVRTGRVWGPNEFVPMWDVVRPSIYLANGRLYTVITPGITGATEPVWPTTASGTVVDGTAQWAEIQFATKIRLLNYFGTANYYTNLMDVIFKDFTFGQPARDKLIRRADIVAYYGQKALAAMRMNINQGNMVMLVGPTPIGEPTTQGDVNDATFGANNQLGVMTLDGSATAEEYQARALRPGRTIGRQAVGPLDGYLDDDTGEYRLGGVIRGRSIQPRFTDDDGIIIDATNNMLSFCTYDTGKPPTIQRTVTAELTNGRYSDMDALMSMVVVAMNVAQSGFSNGTEFAWAPNPWSNDSAFDGGFSPYMTTIQFAFTDRRTLVGPFALAFVFGTSQATTIANINGTTTTVYPVRTKRLLAQIGYDTSEVYRTTSGLSKLFGDTTPVQLIGEQESPLLATPTQICGIQVVPFKRSPVVSLSNVELDYYIKPGLPFSKQSR